MQVGRPSVGALAWAQLASGETWREQGMSATRSGASSQGWYGGLSGDLGGSADSRPPLVLLHEVLSDRGVWTPCLTELSRIDPRRQYLALDLPGHGKSPVHSPHTIENIAEIVHQAVREADFAAPIIVGHWTSGYIAHAYAARYPTRGVINLEPFPDPSQLTRLLRTNVDEIGEPNFIGTWTTVAGYFRSEFLSSSIKDIIQSARRPEVDLLRSYWQELIEQTPKDVCDRLTANAIHIYRLNLPYLFINGSVIELKTRADIARVMPTASVEIWHGGDHYPHLAFPDRFALRLGSTNTWPANNELISE